MIKGYKYYSAIIIPIMAIVVIVGAGYAHYYINQEEEIVKHTEAIFYGGERCDPAPYNGHCRNFISYMKARNEHGQEALNQIDY